MVKAPDPLGRPTVFRTSVDSGRKSPVLSVVEQECGGRVRVVVNFTAIHRGTRLTAMLLPQTANKT